MTSKTSAAIQKNQKSFLVILYKTNLVMCKMVMPVRIIHIGILTKKDAMTTGINKKYDILSTPFFVFIFLVSSSLLFFGYRIYGKEESNEIIKSVSKTALAITLPASLCSIMYAIDKISVSRMSKSQSGSSLTLHFDSTFFISTHI